MALVSFGELAMNYFPLQKPKSATNSLGKYIRRCKQLYEDLCAQGFGKRNKYLTPGMVRSIYAHLGEP